MRITELPVCEASSWIRACRLILLLTCTTSLTFLVTDGIATGDDDLRFSRDIQPILADRCFHCHGRDTASRKGGLRLDDREAALHGGEADGPAIVPGNPDKSALIARITSSDPDVQMPPPSSKSTLKPDEIETLKKWIANGAEYSKHWAFESPVAPPIPPLPETIASKNPIDAFIHAKLVKAGLTFTAPTTPEQICRRIYLDVVGVLPTPQNVEQFVNETKAKGFAASVESLVDGLLKDSRYGEKWARNWLDVARYSDSNGYEKDLPREQWIWRDWVVESLNRDMPYNQFIVEQIAGDMLPDRTSSQLVATGFLRNGMINEEGAIVPEQFRMEGMFDRMDVIGTSILGISLKCAQCHIHKFDPITQNEYYQVFSFINNTFEAQSWVYTSDQEKKIAEVRRSIAEVESRLKAEHPDWAQRLAIWEAAEVEREGKTQWTAVEADDLHSSTELNHPTMLADKSILTLGHRTVSGDVHMLADPPLKDVTGLRLEILRYGDLPFGGPGRSFKGTWALTELVVEAKQPGSDKWERLKLMNATADFSEPSHVMEPEWANGGDKENKRTCGPVAYLADGDDKTAWRADRGVGRRNTDDVAVVQFEKPLTMPPGTRLKIALVTNHGGDDNGSKNTMIGRFRVSLTTTPDPKVHSTPYAAIIAMRTRADLRSPAQQNEIFTAWRLSCEDLKTYNEQIDALWKQYPEALTSVLHLAERGPDDVRDTFVLDRGVWDKPTTKVSAGPISSLNPLEPNGPMNRFAFAKWLVDRRSPLTARVEVNRVWQSIFGVGIQETAEDFGTRAPEPSNQELLDWLAVRFMDEGWSQKKLIRLILTSTAYQQSSNVTPELLEKDPRNRLLSRGPRFRVDAEVLRDVALSAAGMLSAKGGGPSIYPPVPASVLDYNYVRPSYWTPPTGEERYRRSLYLFRKRSMPDPTLSAFDAPNGDFTCPRRVRSNSPLASLTSLNETIFVEAARGLALRILREGGANDASRIDYAFRVCTGRNATPAEIETVQKLIASRRQRIADGWLPTREVATGNPSKLPELPNGSTPADAAVWTVVARVLLNLDETLTKG